MQIRAGQSPIQESGRWDKAFQKGATVKTESGRWLMSWEIQTKGHRRKEGSMEGWALKVNWDSNEHEKCSLPPDKWVEQWHPGTTSESLKVFSQSGDRWTSPQTPTSQSFRNRLVVIPFSSTPSWFLCSLNLDNYHRLWASLEEDRVFFIFVNNSF